MRSLGLARVPLYLTEFGWSTHPAGASKWAPEHLRPRYIETTFAALGHLDCGIAAAVLYTWRSPERDPSNVEDWFGIDSRSGAQAQPTPGHSPPGCTGRPLLDHRSGCVARANAPHSESRLAP